MDTSSKSDPTNQPRSTLDVALGWVGKHPAHFQFPCRGKNQPLLSDYLNAASNDPAQIESWYGFWKHRLGEEPFWGVAPRLSGLVPVDVDVKPGKHGQETYDLLGLLYGWPRTLTVRTPSGGSHHYYSGEHIFEIGSAKTEHRGIDFPQYLIMPGCGEYKVLEDRPIAAAPPWFYQITRRKNEIDTGTQIPATNLDTPENIEWAIHYLTHDAPHSVLGQNGEKVLRDIGAKLKDRGISYEKTCELVQEHYNCFPTCDPPWNYDDGPIKDRLTVKLRNAYLYMVEKAPGEDTPEAEFGDDPPEPLTPEEEAEDKKAKKAVEKEEKKKSKLRELALEWAWIAQIDRWIKRPDPTLFLKTEAFDKNYSQFCPPKESGVSKALFERFPSCKYERAVFAPGKPEHINALFNMWRPSDIEPLDEPPRQFLDHVAYLVPDEASREMLLDWLAWCVQRLTRKMMFAVLLIGEHGTGKSYIADMMKRVVGAHNVSEPKRRRIVSDFNGWLGRRQLVVIHELKEKGARGLADELKEYITQKTVLLNLKGIEAFEIENVANFLTISNHDDAIPLDDTERRYLVIRCAEKPRHGKGTDQSVAYYTDLFAGIEGDEARRVLHWLGKRDIKLAGEGVAPETAARAALIDASRPALEKVLLDALETRQRPLSGRIINPTDVLNDLIADNTVPRGDLNIKTVEAVLRKIGCRPLDWLKQVRTASGRKRLWARDGRRLSHYRKLKTPQDIMDLYDRGRAEATRPAEFDDDGMDPAA